MSRAEEFPRIAPKPQDDTGSPPNKVMAGRKAGLAGFTRTDLESR